MATDILTDVYVDRVANSLPGTPFLPYITRSYAQEIQRLRTALAATVEELLIKDARMAELEELVR